MELDGDSKLGTSLSCRHLSHQLLKRLSLVHCGGRLICLLSSELCVFLFSIHAVFCPDNFQKKKRIADLRISLPMGLC